MQITLKKINQFRPQTLTINGPSTKERGKANIPLSPEGYFCLVDDTYEVIFNENIEGELTGILPIFPQNGIKFYRYIYQTEEGSATLMTVGNGFMRIVPNSVIADIVQEKPMSVKINTQSIEQKVRAKPGPKPGWKNQSLKINLSSEHVDGFQIDNIKNYDPIILSESDIIKLEDEYKPFIEINTENRDINTNDD